MKLGSVERERLEAIRRQELVDASTTNYMLDKLSRMGLIRRVYAYVLTRAGRQALREADDEGPLGGHLSAELMAEITMHDSEDDRTCQQQEADDEQAT